MNKQKILDQLRVQTSGLPDEDRVSKYIVLQIKMRRIAVADIRKTAYWWHQCGDFLLADPEDMRWQTSNEPVLLVLKDGSLVDTTMPRLRERLPQLIKDIRMYRRKLATDDALLQRVQDGIDGRENRFRQGHAQGDQHVIADSPMAAAYPL
ncbi:hypothetical protein D8I35_05290 [Corticibacter populi]|uniref:Uncharacterized protein n=1 Tax=Corticibacter populi TaxID=1550736 RepID=A0A3M6R003_9BURK|nr:hypothetical protein [Corticibacter populi]RMX08493.1 hypothetical protein D8I35_05290 [Corticibacter populi]RZS35807.1 hypothetical protein EV687_0886 [Corticibacter populi]